jgi:hypothetical protein
MRVSALLTSQSFFLIAWAILYGDLLKGNSTKLSDMSEEPIWFLIGIAVLALFTAYLAGVAIWVGCFVIGEWHSYAKTLVNDPRNRDPYRNSIDGCFLPERNLFKLGRRDWHHMLSIDMFGCGLASAFLLFWVIVLFRLSWVWGGLSLASILLGTVWIWSRLRTVHGAQAEKIDEPPATSSVGEQTQGL